MTVPTIAAEQQAAVWEDAPNHARMYDYLLGGRSNFDVDRQVVDRTLAEAPISQVMVRRGRLFQGRVVRWCLRRGIHQFLELASGLPTIGSVHEVARTVCPGARVAYVDDDPVAVAHGEALLADDPLLSITQADIADPAAVLDAPGVAGLLDLSRPVALLAVSALHYVPGPVDELTALLAGYRQRLRGGGALAIAHGRRPPDGITARRVVEIWSRFCSPGTSISLRSTEEIQRLFAGTTLVAPGVVPLSAWPDGAPGAGATSGPPDGLDAGVALFDRDPLDRV